ncbi:Inactive dipeptidyl peptidase 10-like 2 [Homarus americanus]|uniref:Inactive dipeptidyl peptidase 10-like 2 n=1 Tax=Homarus americanus TaxID=6706 RepID=A0A8J5K8P3_HOMAM|nr:Inactive dipeptidyl peptidase 10-like 2 [Homarus americanus]
MTRPSQDKDLSRQGPLKTRPSLRDKTLSAQGPLKTRPSQDKDLSRQGPLKTRPSSDKALSRLGPLQTRPSPDKVLSRQGPFNTSPFQDKALSRQGPLQTRPFQHKSLSRLGPLQTGTSQDKALSRQGPLQTRPFQHKTMTTSLAQMSSPPFSLPLLPSFPSFSFLPLPLPLITPPPLPPLIRTPLIRTPLIRTSLIRGPLIRTPLIRTPLIRTSLIRGPLIRTPLIRTSLIRTPLIPCLLTTSPLRTFQCTRHFRHLAKYTVLQMDSEHVVSVTPFPSKEGHPELQHVVWVPGAAASLVMVHENDIYVKESPTSPVVSRLTTTGERHKVFNGVTDYLYREYVLHSVSAVWASEEGNRLCYASFNDSGVREAKIPVYTDKYATINQVRYPKVDTNNPVATLWVVELGQSPPAPRDLKPPTRVRDQSVGVWDYYFTGVSWVDADTVAVVWRNRAQNVSVVTACTEPMWFCEELYVEESGPRRWATVEKVPLFAMNGTAFVSVAPLVDSTSGTYPHIHQGSTGTVHTIPVTFGTYTVFSVVGWDTENHHVYYVANTETEVAERHLWRVTDVTSPTPRQQECLTCHLNYTTPPCRHFTPYMGPDNFYEVVLQCEGPGVPHTMLYSIVDEEVLLYIHNNTHLQRLSLEMAWPQRKDYRVKLDGGFVAQVRLSIPPEFTEEEAFIYPVMVQVGGVPGEQRVNHKWHVDWTTYLASNKSWVAMEVDVRGASSQDLGLMYKPAWRLGEVEVTDHVAVVNPLIFPRVSLFSHESHHLPTPSLCSSPTASYYTEKYMGTAQVVPGGNYRGYEESSLLLRASSFKNRTLLLVHGSADTDVHYDHTLKFSRALTKKGIIFRQQTYTDEGHDLERVQTHLYKTLESYLEGCFPAYNEEELSLLFGQDALP